MSANADCVKFAPGILASLLWVEQKRFFFYITYSEFAYAYDLPQEVTTCRTTTFGTGSGTGKHAVSCCSFLSDALVWPLFHDIGCSGKCETDCAVHPLREPSASALTAGKTRYADAPRSYA